MSLKVGDKVYISKEAIEDTGANLVPGLYILYLCNDEYSRTALPGTWIKNKYLVPEEIYNSPLAQSMREIDEV